MIIINNNFMSFFFSYFFQNYFNILSAALFLIMINEKCNVYINVKGIWERKSRYNKT